MLKIENITKSYPQRGEVLKGLSLDINAGETVDITGPSGSGKTTLLNIISVLDLPDTGELLFAGKSLSGLSADQAALFRRDNIGFVFQDHLLLPHLSIIDNILVPLLADRDRQKNLGEYLGYADELLDETGIGDIKYK